MYEPYPVRSAPSDSQWRDEWLFGAIDADARVRHLVYLDGRLVDTWVEGVVGTPWEAEARRLDQERHHVCRPAPPATPAHEVTLGWLHTLVGGPEALRELSVGPWEEPARPILDSAAAETAHLAVRDHLERVADRFLGPEVAAILQHALVLLWERDPHGTTARAPNRTAAGLCWVVGRANALFTGGVTQSAVARELWSGAGLSSTGQPILRTLRGVWLHDGGRPPQAPDLLAVGDPRLLTSGTRSELVRWRDAADRALGAARPAEAG